MKTIWRDLRSPLALLMVVTASQAFGALRPHDQRAKEMDAALVAAVSRLAPELVDRVEYTATDKITVRAGRCFVVVDLVTVSTDSPDIKVGTGPLAITPGPRRFEARSGPRSCD